MCIIYTLCLTKVEKRSNLKHYSNNKRYLEQKNYDVEGKN